MTLRHLEIFYEVVKQQSMSKAAKNLYMSQPAVSQAIRELEAFYDTSLFDRMNRKLYLTDAGKTLLEYAKRILSDYESSIDILRNNQYQSHCRIGINVTYSECGGAHILKKLQDTFEEVQFEITIDNSSNIEDMILENKLDLAILDEFKHPQQLLTHELQKTEMIVVSKKNLYPNSSMTLQELSKLPLLLREEGSGNRSVVEATFHNAQLDVKPFLQTTSDLSLLAFVKEGFGVAILPASLADDDFDIIHITDAKFVRSFYVTHAASKQLSKMHSDIINKLLSL